LNSVT